MCPKGQSGLVTQTQCSSANEHLNAVVLRRVGTIVSERSPSISISTSQTRAIHTTYLSCSTAWSALIIVLPAGPQSDLYRCPPALTSIPGFNKSFGPENPTAQTSPYSLILQSCKGRVCAYPFVFHSPTGHQPLTLSYRSECIVII
jgi:hypothetical protein